jgi:EmrB/QacA subfamily drug resistance transporter
MSEPTRSRAYLATMLTASGGTFLAMLDSTVTNLAVPNLHQQFPTASVPGLSWVISGYAVMFAALLAPAGRLADALGRRRLFVLGVGLFTVASLLCALAPSLEVLIATRVLQGAGAAAMIPASLAILLLDGPADKRASSIGLWSASSAVAAAIGPSVGGVLVEWFDWRAVFVINLPFGVLLIVSALRRLAPSAAVSRDRVPDLLGTVLIALGVGGLTLGVTEGGTWGWSDIRTLACIVLGVAFVLVALLRSRTSKVPAVDISLWGNRAFSATNVVSLFYGMAQYPFMLVGVLYVTDIWRYSELQAGLSNTPGAFAASVAALGLGRLAPRFGGPRFAALFGLAAFLACNVWLMFGLTVQPAFVSLWLPAAVLAGTGMGAATMGTSAAAAMSAPPIKFASSSGLNTTARQLGGALGIAAMAVILQNGTSATGTRGIAAYEHVYFFCSILLAVALVVAALWVRLKVPAPAPKPVPAPASAAEAAA